MHRHQVLLYVVAIVVGAAVGLAAPGMAPPLSAAITPVLGLLLFVTFLGVPVAGILTAVRDWRFLLVVLAVNFGAAPVVAFAASRLVAHDTVLVVGALFVLLTPCVDYVIVFTGLAGGARDRLLAAAPLLMLGQLLLLPPLLLMVGPGVLGAIDPAPFAEAFVLLIVLPAAAAAVLQLLARRSRAAGRVEAVALESMVPLMMATLAVVVASQIAGVARELAALLLVVPVFLLFAAAMLPIGIAAGRLTRLDRQATTAVAFSGVTRNSLVVLPLVLALPSGFGLAPLVVVTQTLVELAVMVALVRLVPRLPLTGRARGSVRMN